MILLDMEMPESCNECPIEYDCFQCSITKTETFYTHNKRLPDCPLKELPEHHGDLIDVAALDEKIIDYITSGYANSSEDCAEFEKMLIMAPRIVKEEGEEE